MTRIPNAPPEGMLRNHLPSGYAGLHLRTNSVLYVGDSLIRVSFTDAMILEMQTGGGKVHFGLQGGQTVFHPIYSNVL